MLLVWLPWALMAQVAEDFSDGNFDQNPTWCGTLERFVVENNRLKLDHSDANISGAQMAYLSTSSEVAVEGTWLLRASINTTTSSANYVRFYLTSDNSDLTAPLNGYFVMIGNTADEVSLYRQQGSQKTKIIDGTDKRLDFSSFDIVVKITRDEFGNWLLQSKINDETDFVTEGACNDTNVLGSRYAGIFVSYSKSNIGKYFFEEIQIEGKKFIDNIPPTISDCEVVDENKIQLSFSENVQIRNFALKNTDNAVQTINCQNQIAEIEFAQPLSEGVLHRVVVCGVSDVAGNRLADSTATFYVPALKDVVFNELFADPEPQVALPNAKFIELYNRSQHRIRLKKWQIDIGKTSYTLPDVAVESNDFLIICAAKDTAEFQYWGKTCAVSTLSSMTISGTMLALHATTRRCIDWVEYSSEWHESDFKNDGGWSLERIDTENFNSENNWTSSINERGGTPCAKNSVATANPDTVAPTIEWLAVDAPDTLRLCFSKEMNAETCSDVGNFVLQNRAITNIVSDDVTNRTFTLTLSEALAEGEFDTLQISGLSDISGIALSCQKRPIALLQTAENYHDVVVNELLFNPKDDGVDYVELFNSSDKVWNVAELFVTTRKDGELQKRVPIATHNEPFFPNAYLVLTTNPSIVRTQYATPKDAFFKIVNLPNLPNEEGNIAVITADGMVLDEFAYTEKMHHAFIRNAEGVALERINSQLPTQSAESWQSAASSVGYGTPCARNSQYFAMEMPTTEQRFTLSHKSFSPDNDGFRDLLQINYQMPESGFVASITIFTANGQEVKTLENNVLLGESGTFFWDGTDQSGALCNVGVYVLYIEFLHPSGTKGHERIVCSLTSQ